MKKHSVRAIAILLLVAITIPFAYADTSVPPDARSFHYVAMGDSISAYFRVEKGQGYAEILADFLKNEPGFGGLYLTNLSRSGDDSTDILNMADAYADTIRDADLITISIGANNFLGLLLGRIYGFLEERYGADYTLDSLEIDDSLLNEMTAAFGGLSLLAEVARGIERFRTDINTLIVKLKELSPSVDIYFMTVYTPLSEADSIYAAVDMLIRSVNSIIEENSGLGYTVVDVYSAFRELDAEGLSFVDLSAGSFDPHPSVFGHRLIAGTHYNAITGKELEIPDDYAPVIPLNRADVIASMFEGVFAVSPVIMSSIYGNNTDVRAFSDVPEYHPLYRYITEARRFGIVNGVGNDLFLPYADMSRQEYAVALSRLFSVLEDRGFSLNLPDLTDVSLPDIGSAALYASDAIRQFAGTSLMPLRNGMIDPLSPITSAELAALKVYIVSGA